MMEIKTCEQYVLSQLFGQQDENDRVLADNRRLREAVEDQRNELAEWERRMNSAMAKVIHREGRRALLDVATDGHQYRARVKNYNGDQVIYEAWSIAVVCGHIPDDVSASEFLREFEPELRELYAKRLEEEGFGPSDAE